MSKDPNLDYIDSSDGRAAPEGISGIIGQQRAMESERRKFDAYKASKNTGPKNGNGFPVLMAIIGAIFMGAKYMTANPADYAWVGAAFIGLFGGMVIGAVISRYKVVTLLVILAAVGYYLKVLH